MWLHKRTSLTRSVCVCVYHIAEIITLTGGKSFSCRDMWNIRNGWRTKSDWINDMIAIRIHAPAFRFHYDLLVWIPRDDILCLGGSKIYTQHNNFWLSRHIYTYTTECRECESESRDASNRTHFAIFESMRDRRIYFFLFLKFLLGLFSSVLPLLLENPCECVLEKWNLCVLFDITVSGKSFAARLAENCRCETEQVIKDTDLLRLSRTYCGLLLLLWRAKALKRWISLSFHLSTHLVHVMKKDGIHRSSPKHRCISMVVYVCFSLSFFPISFHRNLCLGKKESKQSIN